MNKLKEQIAELINHGLTDREILEALDNETPVVSLDETRSEDLIAVIRDLLTNGNDPD